MENVEFEEDLQFQILRKKTHKKNPPLVGLVLKLGLAQSEKQANMVLGIIIIIAFAGAGTILFRNTLFSPQNDTIQYKEDLTPKERQELPPDFIKSLPSRNG